MKGKRYCIDSICPYCKGLTSYNNIEIENRMHYTFGVTCRKCFMRYSIVSRVYKLEMDYYNELDFLRKRYLFIKDRFKKKNM